MAQVPETAKYDGMPRSAIEAQVVDRVLALLRPGGLFFIGTAEGRVPCATPLQAVAKGLTLAAYVGADAPDRLIGWPNKSRSQSAVGSSVAIGVGADNRSICRMGCLFLG